MYILLADSPQDVPRIEAAVDPMFRNSPSPTRTETEQQLELDFISTLAGRGASLDSGTKKIV
jgi:hypothetical protein